MPEGGDVMLHGIRAEVTFYKDFFEKIHLQADFLQMGDFKGAAEPYMRSSMSPQFRKQLETVIDDFFEKSQVESDRQIAAREELDGRASQEDDRRRHVYGQARQGNWADRSDCLSG